MIKINTSHILPDTPAGQASAAYTRTIYTTIPEERQQEGAVDSRTTYRPVYECASAPEEIRKDMRAAIEGSDGDKSDEAAAFLDVTEEEAFENDTSFFMLLVQKVVEYDPQHLSEYQNGGMNWQVLSRDGTTATFLLSNTGGRFEVGDTVRFESSALEKSVYVFETTLTDVVEEHLDVDLGSTGTLRLSPVSMQLRRTYREREEQDVTLRLKDGTEFTAASINNGYTYAPYGSCGTMTRSSAISMDPDDPWEEVTWAFGRIIDLDEVEAVIVGGEVYPIS